MWVWLPCPPSSLSPHEGRVSPARSQQRSGSKACEVLYSAPFAALLASPGLHAKPGTGRSLCRLVQHLRAPPSTEIQRKPAVALVELVVEDRARVGSPADHA